MTTLVIIHNFVFIHFRQRAVDEQMIKEKRVLSALVDNMQKYEANSGEVIAPEGGHPQFH